jgi:hypothetical protein
MFDVEGGDENVPAASVSERGQAGGGRNRASIGPAERATSKSGFPVAFPWLASQ